VYLTGFADEASHDVDVQIRATKELGWEHIESRNAGSGILHDIPDAEFEEVCRKLADAGVKVNCFGSSIMNWNTDVQDPIEPILEQTKRAIERMHRLGTKLIRVMSFKWYPDRETEDQLFEQRVEKMNRVIPLFVEAGIQPVHENCMNYGGLGWPFTLQILENVPGLKLVFDTANPVFSQDRTKPKPYPTQSSWEFYQHVKQHVVYIHIKDCTRATEKEKGVFTFPGEGDGDVKRILKDLLDGGYDGGISIEPHLAVVFHDEAVQSTERVRYENYVEYGRRIEKLLVEIGHGDKLG